MFSFAFCFENTFVSISLIQIGATCPLVFPPFFFFPKNKFTRENFEAGLKPFADHVAKSTLRVYQNVASTFLPTPSKSHYVFNLRDISAVFQGLHVADRNFCDTSEALARLWVHESLRVFADRLVDHADFEKFRRILDLQLQKTFEVTWQTLFARFVWRFLIFGRLWALVGGAGSDWTAFLCGAT